MSDWQAGDLALCVVGGKMPGNIGRGPFPETGKIYTVEKAGAQKLNNGKIVLCLQLLDGPSNITGKKRWAASRFVKVTPPANMENDLQDIDLPITVEG